jgi:hypothetical protein
MPQTMLALFSLVLVTLFSINQARLTTSAQMSMMRNEVGVVGTGVAAQVFDLMASKPFDAKDNVESPADLTPAASFGGSESWDLAADLDDYHGKSRSFSVPTGLGTLTVNAAVAVEYVQKSGQAYAPSTTQTYFKRVTLTLTGPVGYQGSIERIYSYGDLQNLIGN